MASRGRADADAAQRPPRVRLTGFGKFRGVPDNPTLRLVHALPASLAKEPIPGLAAEDVEFEVLETSADAVQSYLTRCVSEHAAAGDRPLLLLHFGVFEGSDAFRIETCGYNEADFRVADERGFMPRKERISEGEPSGAALRTAVPVEALVSRLAARQHIPVVASDNPGRFVCNYLLYSSLHATRGLSPPATALFVHVPGHGTAPHEDQVAFARLVLQELIALHHAPTSQSHGAEQGDAGPLPDGGGSAAAMSDPDSQLCSGGADGAGHAAAASEQAPPAGSASGDTGDDADLAFALALSMEADGGDQTQQQAGPPGGEEGASAGMGSFLRGLSNSLGSMFQRHKMVILVRDDLRMGRGKTAAQCCHAVLALYRRVSREQRGRLQAWEGYGEAKVVLRVPDLAALQRYEAAARAAGLPTAGVMDAGRTQVAPGSHTAVAIGPGSVSEVDQITGSLRLL